MAHLNDKQAFHGKEIRKLRQRLGWSLAEMARRMGCDTTLIGAWETDAQRPDSEALNQMIYLQNHVESISDEVAQEPVLEKEIESRRVAQLTHRDLLKDIL